jgi:photosystem II stability/assembly factor-like uncharacterized protein
MTEPIHYLAGNGALFLQPSGPNTAPAYMGCHMLGDLEEPRGDVTLLFCPDPSRPNAFRVIGSFKGAPGPVTTAITADTLKKADYLETIRCPVPIYVHKISCGRTDVFRNYDRTFILNKADITSITRSNQVARDPDNQDRSMQEFAISAQELLLGFNLQGARQSVSETEALNGVVACGDLRCAGDCGDDQEPCDIMYAIGDAAGGSPSNVANVLVTTDGGATWTETAANPFAAAEDIRGIACFSIDKNTTRIIVGRGTTDAGNPAEIAYSDDSGATWTLVDVGAVLGQYFVGGKDAIFALDYNHVWAVTSGGYIYFSSDGGATWTAQESAVLTTEDYQGVSFSDDSNGYAVANSDVIVRTLDGGDTWSAVSATGGGANILSVEVLSDSHAWVGDAAASLYFTKDGGTTWTERDIAGASDTGTITAIQFINELQGALLHNTAGPVGTLYYTNNGGYDWQAVVTPSNAGLNSLVICSSQLIYAVGEPQGGTAFVLKALP